MSGYVEEVATLLERIAPLIQERHLPHPRWISTPDGDLGTEWCSDCGYYKVRNLRQRDRKRAKDYILDGGWRTEEEHQCFCAGCGVQLGVSLTDYGVDQELDHFDELGFSNNPAQDAYDISELLNTFYYQGDNEGDEQAERRARAIAVAVAFLESLS